MEERVCENKVTSFEQKELRQKGKKIDFKPQDIKKESKVTYICPRNTVIKDFDMEVSSDMDDNKLLEKYLDKVDQDRRDQETRLNSNMKDLEERLSKERIASEERLEKLFKMTMDSIKDTNSKIDNISDKLDSKIDSINEKLDTNVDSINQKLDSKMDLMSEKIDSTNKWIIGTCIATILAVAAIAASVWF